MISGSEPIAPPDPSVDPDCLGCGGSGYVRVPIGTPGRPPDGLVRCACHPAPLVEVPAEGAKRELRRRAGRADWWSK